MRKIYISLGCALLMLTNNLSAQVVFSEDFGTAVGTTPPTNWTNNDIAGFGEVWAFDNPGGRNLTAPISDPAAIFDSDNNGFDGNAEEAALESPVFDASALTGYVFLSFDQYFDAQYGGESYVEVWDGSAWVEVYSSFTTTNDPDHQLIDITSVLNLASDAQVRFRWVGDYSMFWIVDNVVVEATTCPPITLLSTSNETTNTIDLSWTMGNSETSWNIEWGPVGFTPGAGEEDGADVSGVESYTITGLTPGTDYDIYVQADCGGNQSFWTHVTGTTLCAPITTFPWLENFDAMPVVDYNLFPNCWLDENGEWLTDNESTGNTYNTAPYSGDNFLAIFYGNDDYIWAPEMQLTAGKTYEFSFMWAGDTYDGWDGEVLVNSSQSSTNAVALGVPFVTSADAFDQDYRKEIFCFTPDSTGVYSFAVHIASSFNPFNITFDDFSVIERAATAGSNGAMNVCQTEGLVDLNDIITKDDQNGTWTFSPNPNTISNDSLFDPQFVPTGTIDVLYITSGCLLDTATATITIYGPSSAGNGSTITACKNQPLNLLVGLSGNVDMGGDWYDPSNTALANGQITTGNFTGQFNYDYVTGNSVCPDDTSEVIVSVGNCDWLSVEENELDGVEVYPNPSTGLVYIESDFSTGSFNLFVTDVNGRVIETGTNTITNGTNMVNLNKVQSGTYFFKLSNAKAEKVYRVVIQ